MYRNGSREREEILGRGTRDREGRQRVGIAGNESDVRLISTLQSWLKRRIYQMTCAGPRIPTCALMGIGSSQQIHYDSSSVQ